MECSYFGKCGSCTLYALDYQAQVAHKKTAIKTLFEPLHVKEFTFFESACEHYRGRAEFRIWKEGEKIHYAMGAMDKKRAVCIDACPKVEERIDTLMPKLLKAIEGVDVLRERIFAIEFLSSSEHLLVTLIYHKPLDKAWEKEAKKLEEVFNIFVIGRSRGIKKVLSQDFIEERFALEAKSYRYHIIEGGFSQPNRTMNQTMIGWVLSHLESCEDLLELYCGYGNFTLPMAGKFNKVLATEISKTSIASALKNCELNDVSNITFLRLSAEELTSALNKERTFNRLAGMNLDDYAFSHVFVDPPRSGMDEKSLAFISRFENIIYISCNPQTLKRDLEVLCQNYTIEHFALFDQFPNTEHLESGVILKRH
ncbi:tRNA (uridine(54)-C5)-methyltransferase TrmA [Sulfurospirillum deleyianum]|uniref:tRNA (Uracil-5-)-methyltransferase n=1 Tax=Sulfurospirillum deleyianum (strain ATCC 51133 / DSM 6946 / 5175) TaxID=525898 RepID=D1B1S1_SULD5|nr:tRNA (uridine(54)-C5)-methyltransferase TrmA [Sulfurospirillum deleyianum]ACZ12041.1 tRNA (uracil-5-)-methyltransferase [Sulfurospirillum deleyianum DSM 6946]